MQPPLKRLSTGTGQQEGQRMQDVDENFGRVEQAIDTLNANVSLYAVTGNILDLVESLGVGIRVLNVTGSATGLPSAYYNYTPGLYLARSADDAAIVLFSYSSGQIATNVKRSGTWIGWAIIG